MKDPQFRTLDTDMHTTRDRDREEEVQIDGVSRAAAQGNGASEAQSSEERRGTL